MSMIVNVSEERESVAVLRECIELQNKKGEDYQSSKSSVRQADYYPNGITTIHDIMHAKMLRMKSIMEKELASGVANFESLEDSAKDLINYASFFVAFCRGKVDGQDPKLNKYNKANGALDDNVTRAVKTITLQSHGVPVHFSKTEPIRVKAEEAGLKKGFGE